NIREVVAAGADVLVAGSAVFNTADYAATITALRENAANTTA
ncbi:MAG: ribulose-phosphate 3-epimerase, partial [Deltaproteobacteria bacterium]